jgi:hypothetical protein
MTTFAPGALAPVAPPTSPDGQHLVLLAALTAVAEHGNDHCHGFGARTHPAEFARCVLHDLDLMVGLPTAKATP